MIANTTSESKERAKSNANGVSSRVLLPCPFCGAPGSLGDRSDAGFWAVYCGNLDYACSVDPHTGWRRSPEEAVSIWNTRHDNAKVQATGYAVLLRSKDGREWLAHGSNGLPWFSIKWTDAHTYRRELRAHNLRGKVVRARGQVTRLHTAKPNAERTNGGQNQ